MSDNHDALRNIESSLAVFVDTLLPGDGEFPAASTVGTQRVLADRIRAHYGADQLVSLGKLIDACGGPLPSLDSEGRIAVVRRLEIEHPAAFQLLRQITYLSYYESAAVIQAIRALGHDYHATPQPHGYALTPFDALVDAPKHQRGRYQSTQSVKRVDVSGLGNLTQEE